MSARDGLIPTFNGHHRELAGGVGSGRSGADEDGWARVTYEVYVSDLDPTTVDGTGPTRSTRPRQIPARYRN
jgi:hypothetical protein